jgi:hypothetical protein
LTTQKRQRLAAFTGIFIKSYRLSIISSETLSLLRPLALRAAIVFLPLADDILFLNPCLFLLFLLDG